MTIQTAETDVLIIGGGIAAAEAAIAARKYGVEVLLVDKGRFGSSGASATSGGNPQAYVPAPWGGHPEDSPDALFQDIVVGGCFLSAQEMTEILASEISNRVMEADSFGVPFLKDAGGKLFSFKTMGTSYPRVGPVRNWGIGMMLAFRKEALHRGVRCLENVRVMKLLRKDEEVLGALAVDREGRIGYRFTAAAVVLACGSAHELYPLTSASYTTTGDAYFLAFDAGAELTNMEFEEFTLVPAPGGVPLPTGGIKPTLSSGGCFFNARGDRFLRNYDPERMENTSRSTLIRAVHTELSAGRGPCCIDTSAVHEPRTEVEKFKFLALRKLISVGIDPKTEPVPWIPAVHSFLGGARIDTHCETNIKGLYAAGEAAGHGSLFGADRGGSAIAACMVLGARAGKHAALRALAQRTGPLPKEQEHQATHLLDRLSHGTGIFPTTAKKEIQQLAQAELFISRSQGGLERAIRRFAGLRSQGIEDDGTVHAPTDVLNLALTGELVARAALTRCESRGQHTRSDFPEQDDRNWLTQIVLRKDEKDNTVEVRKVPIPVESYRLRPEGRHGRSSR